MPTNFVIRRYDAADHAGVLALHARVEPYREEDASAVATMHTRASEAEQSGQGWAPLKHGPDTLDDIEATYAAFWVGVQSGEVIGMVGARDGVVDAVAGIPDGASLLSRDDVVELRRLRVAPECWRNGVGIALSQAVIDWARGCGYRTLVLNTTAAQAPARALYERLGFREIGCHFLGQLEIVWYVLEL